MTKTEERAEKINDSKHRARQTFECLVQNLKRATGLEPALQDETIDLLVTVTQKKSCLKKQTLRCLAPSFLRMSQKRSTQSRRQMSFRPSQSRRPSVQTETSTNRRQNKELKRGRDRETNKSRGQLSAGESKMTQANIRATGSLKRQGANQPQINFSGPTTTSRSLIFKKQTPRVVIQKGSEYLLLHSWNS